MNKNLGVFLSGFVFVCSSAFAVDGKINFTGSVIDSACSVTNNESTPLTVNLGKVSKSTFSGVGSTAAATKFSLELKNCPETISSATVKFDGIAVNGDGSLIALNSDNGAATGLGIQITDSANKIVSLSTPSSTYSLMTGKDNVNSLDFTARYVATSETVTSGTANADVNFTIIYN